VSVLSLYLASASPRRRELLAQLGLDPTLLPVPVDETPRTGEAAQDLVRRLAAAKGREARRRLPPGVPALLLAADTAVVIDGECLGKPADPDDARAMLQRLCGRAHEVLTGVYLLRTDDAREVVAVDSTMVRFRSYDAAAVEAYLASGEGTDKAGGYGIQGRGVLFVDGIDGSWSNVVGLPLERLTGWLDAIGVDLWQLMRSSDSAA
jgi:septum formation protein